MIPVYGTININQAKAASTAPETAWGGWHDDTNLISTECCIVTGAQFLHCCVQVGVVEVVDFLPSHIERKVIFPNIILYYYVLSLCIYMYICHIRDFSYISCPILWKFGDPNPSFCSHPTWVSRPCGSMAVTSPGASGFPLRKRSWITLGWCENSPPLGTYGGLVGIQRKKRYLY